MITKYNKNEWKINQHVFLGIPSWAMSITHRYIHNVNSREGGRHLHLNPIEVKSVGYLLLSSTCISIEPM